MNDVKINCPGTCADGRRCEQPCGHTTYAVRDMADDSIMGADVVGADVHRWGVNLTLPAGALGALEPTTTLDDDWSKSTEGDPTKLAAQQDVTRFQLVPSVIEYAADALVQQCHGASKAAGWWTHLATGLDLVQVIRRPVDALQKLLAGALVAQKLCLSHSELSEAMEGERKGLMDDKLPQYPMSIVELADAWIRIGDLAGAMIKPDAGYTFGEVVAAKMLFNAQREDHKAEVRQGAGGKAF